MADVSWDIGTILTQDKQSATVAGTKGGGGQSRSLLPFKSNRRVRPMDGADDLRTIRECTQQSRKTHVLTQGRHGPIVAKGRVRRDPIRIRDR